MNNATLVWIFDPERDTVWECRVDARGGREFFVTKREALMGLSAYLDKRAEGLETAARDLRNRARAVRGTYL